ncbi:LysR family transcriptional regulator [Paraburkholderia sp. DHOC27]|uniref:LysR family transcriptional regulator n=1 Tax=Paraburkholderia sp. DHOC27 TaxID=2303330 RepID=UPI000E3B85AC|nr:LysR family transcriptional regulator [Paraburkholderia sp. DHOC27]RFU47334.1 LysR family transcriptional regulator [Paraburkholderia sp. DHOC27]
MDLNLREIRAFIAVAEAGSFTRAALRLHLSQPALTVQIRRLEEMVGARLFDRNSRNVALTPVGRELLPVLQKSLREMEHVLLDARALSDGSTGTVRIACLPSFAASLLPDLVLDFRQQVPGAAFDIRDVVANGVNALVRSEQVDLGLTGGEPDDPLLEVLHAGEDRLCIVCPLDHPLTKKRRVTLESLTAYPLVLTASGTSVRAVVASAFEEAGVTLAPTCEPMYMMTAVGMVRAGLGLTILPSSAREILAEPSVVALAIDDARFVRPIALIKKRGRTLPPVTEAFAAALTPTLQDTKSRKITKRRPA